LDEAVRQFIVQLPHAHPWWQRWWRRGTVTPSQSSRRTVSNGETEPTAARFGRQYQGATVCR
jgi:hypothetical protein